MQLLLRALAGIALAFCAVEAWMFYSQPAPFHQFYRDASDAQNATVTRQMMVVLVGTPLTMIGVAAVIAGRRLRQNPKRWLLVLAGIWLLSAVQGCAVRLALRYGFGSGYEHASPSQLAHLSISASVGATALLLAVATLIVRAFVPRR